MLKKAIASKHMHMYGTTEVWEDKMEKNPKIALSCQIFISVSLKILSKIPAECYCAGMVFGTLEMCASTQAGWPRTIHKNCLTLFLHQSWCNSTQRCTSKLCLHWSLQWAFLWQSLGSQGQGCAWKGACKGKLKGPLQGDGHFFSFSLCNNYLFLSCHCCPDNE